jgi:hypothetical protein
MSADIYQIIQRLAQIEEGQVTPTGVKKGLNSQQQSVPQLPALFKPRKISALTNTQDPDHPVGDYFVGEAEVAEDQLSQLKKSFGDYLDSLENEIAQRDLQKKKPDTREVQKKSTDTGNLVPRKTESAAVKPEHAVKSITLENGSVCEIHGNEHEGFGIQHQGRSLKSRFEQLEHAVVACEMFNARLRANLTQSAPAAQAGDQDYIEER